MSIQSMHLDDKLKCPQCGGDNDSATGPRKPKDGDITICAYCAGINQFKIEGNRIELVEAPDKLIEEIRLQDPHTYNHIITVVKGIERMQKD